VEFPVLPPPPDPKRSMLPYKLVVLDLNGVLVDRVFSTVPDAGADMVVTNNYGSSWNVYFKPKCNAFIDYLFKNGFEVAVWTSACKENAEEIVDKLFYDKDLVFFKSQEDCVCEHKTGMKKPMFYKPVDRVEGYSPGEILFIDDTSEKMKFNRGAYHLDPTGATLGELMLLVTSNHAKLIEREDDSRQWITVTTMIIGLLIVAIIIVLE
jgi:hypothetical protein